MGGGKTNYFLIEVMTGGDIFVLDL